MSDELKKTLPRIRTYRDDFDHAREKSGIEIPEGADVPKPVAPTVLQAATPTPAVAVTKDEEVTPVTPPKQVEPVITETPTVAPIKAAPTITVRSHEKEKTITPLQNKKSVTVRAPKPKNQTSTVTATVGTATIITDGKRTHQPVVSTIFENVKKWFQTITTPKKITPRYTVTQTERRKGVIQKATTKTGAIFTADNDRLREQIRRRNLAEKSNTAQHDPEIIWTPNTEPAQALLDAPHIASPQNVTVEFKRQASTVDSTPATIPSPQPSQTYEDNRWSTPQPAVPPPVFVEPTPVPTPIEVPVIPTEPAPTASPQNPAAPSIHITIPAALQKTQDTTAPLKETSQDEPYEFTVPEAHYRIRSIGDVTKINTNILSIGLVGVIAVLIVIIIGIKGFFGMVLTNLEETTVPPATPIATSLVEDIVLDPVSSDALRTAIANTSTESTVREIRLVDAEGLPIAKDALFTLFGFTNNSLNRTITDIHLLVSGGTYGVVFTVTDTTTAFGSLLLKESELASTVAPTLFASTPGTLVITDETVGNTDVRVLATADTEVLVYGFISTNTILITNTRVSFGSLIGREK